MPGMDANSNDATTPTDDSEDTLAAAARDYYRAMRGEFLLDQSQQDTIKDNGKTTLVHLLPNALEELRSLMEAADSESVRWAATKWVLENTLGDKDPEEGDLARLLRGLRANDAKPQPAPAE
jgi:hypothetical protein